MVNVTDHLFWLNFMDEQTEKGTISNISGMLSRYIVFFCFTHNPTPQVFQQLTNEKYLPSIHREAAVRLLHLEQKTLDDDSHDQNAENPPRQFSNLQIRCVNTIVRSKQNAKVKEKFSEDLKKCASSVLYEIITRSFYGIPSE
jgi:hypothetical protein